MGIPKYQQIKEDLLKKIQAGEFEHGDRFYSEAELVKLYDVSSITVIRAIQDLANDGYLVRYQGKGTFVSRSRKRKLVEFSDIEVFAGKSETVEVLSIEEGNDEAIKKQMKLRKKDSYYKITRLRKVDDVPFIVHFSYIPAKFIQKDYPSLDFYDSIYNRFRKDFGIYMYDEASKEINSICFPTDSSIAGILQMDEHEPTVYQEKTTMLKDGTIAELVFSYKKWDYYKFELSTSAE